MSDPIRPTDETEPGYGEPGEAGAAAWGQPDPDNPIEQWFDRQLTEIRATTASAVRAAWRWLVHHLAF